LPSSFSFGPATEEEPLLYESFDQFNLRRASREALAAMDITTPTPIQSATLGALLEGRDVIGQARTGSGKTLAFALPMLERVDRNVPGVQALVLVPTRELEVQVAGVIEKVAGRSGPRVVLLYGGKPLGPQMAALRNGAQVVVGTPGRTLDHLRQGSLNLGRVTYLVLDEADEMLDRGFAPDVERILSRAPRDRQTALFSATVGDWVHEVAAEFLDDPLSVRIDMAPDQTAPSVEQLVYQVPDGHKQAVLETLLDRRGDGAVVVFGRTKHGVKKLGAKLAAKGFPVATLQGNLSQNARDRAMADFRAGRLPVLVATNVAARGLDVSNVEQVINFELPESAELFTHRTGRTGRMGRRGEAITLISPSDADQWRKLERELGRRLEKRVWDEPLTGTPDMTEVARTERRGGFGRRTAPRRPGERPAWAGRSAERSERGGRPAERERAGSVAPRERRANSSRTGGDYRPTRPELGGRGRGPRRAGWGAR
jgi:ATP-dependent RNA helicase DeaD